MSDKHPGQEITKCSPKLRPDCVRCVFNACSRGQLWRPHVRVRAMLPIKMSQ